MSHVNRVFFVGVKNYRSVYRSLFFFRYETMLRIQKRYSFRFRTSPTNKKLIPGFDMTFSSFPGGIQSGDDFYLMSSGLATLETTNENYNKSLWSNVKPVGQVNESVPSSVTYRNKCHCGVELARGGSQGGIFSQTTSNLDQFCVTSLLIRDFVIVIGMKISRLLNYNFRRKQQTNEKRFRKTQVSCKMYRFT